MGGGCGFDRPRGRAPVRRGAASLTRRAHRDAEPGETAMVRPHTDENQVTAPISHTVCRQAATNRRNKPPARTRGPGRGSAWRSTACRVWPPPRGAVRRTHARRCTVSRRAQLPPAHLYVEHACLTPDELKNPTRFEFRYNMTARRLIECVRGTHATLATGGPILLSSRRSTGGL